MVHSFHLLDKYFLFDVNSGTIHDVDELTYLVYKADNGDKEAINALVSKNIKEIQECENELLELKKQGLLDTLPLNIKYQPMTNVKALCLESCYDCNLSCEYCFAGKYVHNVEYMSSEIGKKAIDFLIKNSGDTKNLEVDFFGGEPLLNLDSIKEVVEYAKEEAKKHNKFFKFTLTTNCVLLNEETAKYLNEEMDNVVLSIDGRECVHNGVRKSNNGVSCYSKIIENAKNFVNIRGDKNYYVRGTFTRKNLDFKKDILFLADQGFKQISIEPVVLPSSSPLAIREEDVERIKKEYEDFTKEYVERRKDEESWFSFFHFNCDFENGPCIQKRLSGCSAGCSYLAVAPDGEIYPCHQFVDKKEFKLGDVDNGINNEKAREVFLKTSVYTKPACENCFAKFNCGGGCNANNYNLYKDVNISDKVACELFRKRLECSIYIYAKEKETE